MKLAAESTGQWLAYGLIVRALWLEARVVISTRSVGFRNWVQCFLRKYGNILSQVERQLPSSSSSLLSEGMCA